MSQPELAPTRSRKRRPTVQEKIVSRPPGQSQPTIFERKYPRTLERELRERLEGVRLIAELSLDQALYDEVTETMQGLVDRGMTTGPEIARKYPALLVTYLVSEGIYSYKAGAFWPNLKVRGFADTYLGPAFEIAMHRLGLDMFEQLVWDERAKRYLAPILAHGGIPKYCLGDFFRLLLRDLRAGTVDAENLLAHWRTTKTRFENIDRPVQRFLLHGGEIAVDLIDRCIDLVHEHSHTKIHSSKDLGLPSYVVEAFSDLPAEVVRGPGRGVHQASVPRPKVKLDPWDPGGPSLELPTLPRSLQSGSWQVFADELLRRYDGSHTQSRIVRLAPARSWHVELHEGFRSVRRFTFEGLEQIKALFFDPSDGSLVRDPELLRLSNVWILAPEDAAFAGTASGNERRELSLIEELPRPTGSWEGYRLDHLDLDGIASFAVGRTGDPEGESRVRVITPTSRPRLDGNLVEGIRTAEGETVFAGVPSLFIPNLPGVPLDRWTLRLRGTEYSVTASADQLTKLSECLYSLDSLVPSTSLCSLELVLHGPLGFDLRAFFAVVKGLRANRPDRILFPHDTGVHIVVSAEAPIQIADAHAGASVDLTIPDDVDEVHCNVCSEDTSLALRIQVPRLFWGISRTDEPSVQLANSPVAISAPDLQTGVANAFVVRGRCRDIPMRLLLHSPTAQLQEDFGHLSGSEGRWTFDLARFRDTVRSSGESRLQLSLDIQDQLIKAVDISAVVEVTNISAESYLREGYSRILLTFDEEHPLGDRVARLWPIHRPWAPPIVEPIHDDVRRSASIEGFERVPPGRYIAEIAVDDGWTTPIRPRYGAPNTAVVLIGSREDHDERLAQLDIDDPLAVLEIAASEGRVTRNLAATELQTIAGAVLQTALLMIEDGWHTVTSHRLAAVCEILFREPGLLFGALTDACARASHSKRSILSLAIATLDRVHEPTSIDSHVLRALWGCCAPFAAAIDVSRSGEDPEAAARCEQFLGWAPDLQEQEIPAGEPFGQQWIGMPMEQLASIQNYLELVPDRLFSYDALVLAHFEWLRAEKERRVPPFWWSRYRHLPDALSPSSLVASHLDARQAELGVANWAGIPRVILAAAVHLVQRTEHYDESMQALIEAAEFAPNLITRDLVLAVALVSSDSVGVPQ